MRTAGEFDPNNEKVIEHIRRDRGIGVSDAVNDLNRRGVIVRPAAGNYEPIHRNLGLRTDVPSIAEVLDLIEGPNAR